MLIMPTSSKNFQALADRVASDFLTKGISIEDGVVKVATATDMVPEEVRRLVEKSNTAASVLFLKNASDKKATFKLAEVEEVLKRTHPTSDDKEEDEDLVEDKEDNEEITTEEEDDAAAERIYPESLKEEKKDEEDKEETKEASYKQPRLPHNRFKNQQYQFFDIKNTKTASTPEPKAAYSLGDLQLAQNFTELRKQEKLAAENFLQQTIDSLVTKYEGRRKPEFSKLASDAIMAWGKELKPVLKAVADHIGTKIRLDKTAAYIDDRTPDMQLLKQAAEALEVIRIAGRMISGTEGLTTRATDFWKGKAL